MKKTGFMFRFTRFIPYQGMEIFLKIIRPIFLQKLLSNLLNARVLSGGPIAVQKLSCAYLSPFIIMNFKFLPF